MHRAQNNFEILIHTENHYKANNISWISSSILHLKPKYHDKFDFSTVAIM